MQQRRQASLRLAISSLMALRAFRAPLHTIPGENLSRAVGDLVGSSVGISDPPPAGNLTPLRACSALLRHLRQIATRFPVDAISRARMRVLQSVVSHLSHIGAPTGQSVETDALRSKAGQPSCVSRHTDASTPAVPALIAGNYKPNLHGGRVLRQTSRRIRRGMQRWCTQAHVTRNQSHKSLARTINNRECRR